MFYGNKLFSHLILTAGTFWAKIDKKIQTIDFLRTLLNRQTKKRHQILTFKQDKIYTVEQMASTGANLVKKAASLLLCRSAHKLNSFYNYEILMLERKNSLRSYGSMYAFPGGKFQPTLDEQLASRLGVSRFGIATALRQCFEQTGLYLTDKPCIETSKISDLNQIKLEYIASQFYNNCAVSNSQMSAQRQKQCNADRQLQIYKFYKRITEIVRPKTDLLPFIRLITVPILKQRFDAYFFIHKIQQFKLINFLKYAQSQKYLHSQDNIILNDESASFGWLTPAQILQNFMEKKIKLAPPQFIMLNIMTSFHKYEQLEQFLRACSQNWINMGPNIVSMVNNTGYMKEEYPYAATLVGDLQFPYQFCKKNQKNQYLIEQIRQCEERVCQWEGQAKNRLLFKKPLQFFQDQYSNQCTIPNSVMSKFMSSAKLKEQLELYQ